ncbi:C40 family peptidase [Pedobacter sp. SYSU D00535]|uniref:C40 family peptidase n=1 Tax=Pedobacter sp. SYSU D00535 TaxID=2810308 RepID=UPI001F6218B0|nr:NlpC/P60 family protein [Pedobacter sp. SYSU D00535]
MLKTSDSFGWEFFTLSDMLWFRIRFYRVFFLIAFGTVLLQACSSKKTLTDSSRARGKEIKGSMKERYAALLEVSERDIRNEKLYRFIDEWMGVPHKSGGMDRRGADCSGFTTILQREIFDRNVPRTARQMAENVKRKYEEDLEEGDLVFFDLNGQKFSHVGVYLQNGRFVHVSTSKGVVVSRLKDPWYYKYFSRAGSVRQGLVHSDLSR